ncbi:unnamed protein product [Brassicogethes aeneus]|uniref:Ion transport domain-containing protein n=1 Tax=Brassicogethes aeneus TaxID=1431903 RepID=A0A9P0BEP5_BRAAE|nr:unnamed protein product [Brassicogethes aeneus]
MNEIPATSLHDAVMHGSHDRVTALIENGADADEKDDNGNPPLLLTVCIQEEEIYNGIVWTLIKNGADVNASNKGLTPLYNAVFYRRIKSIKMLLEAGAWLNKHSNNYELHLLAQNGDKEILELFLKDSRCTSTSVNLPDSKGRTAVYFAAENCHKTTLKMLLNHGGVLSCTCERGNVFEAIFEEVSSPVEFLQELLSAQISLRKVKINGMQKKNYNIDFGILAPNTSERQMEVISNLVASASEEERTEVLQHPLIDLFLTLKWAKTSLIFHGLIAIYLILAIVMGVYVTIFVHDVKREMRILRMFIICIMFFTSVLILAYGVLQFVLEKRNHFRRFEMWTNIICSILSLSVAIMAFFDFDNGNIRESPNWVLHVTSIAVLLAWIELMLLIGRLPTFGYYALMFAAVLQNVIKVLATFLCLMIGFALSFSIQFYDVKQFSTPWLSLVKTSVMMMGELEYKGLFHSEKYALHVNVASQVMYLSFIILTSVVLMNLMVGLAVSDIQGLQKASLSKKLEKQADFLRQLEELIYLFKRNDSKKMPRWIKSLFVKNINISTNFTIEASASFRKNSQLSKRLIDTIVSIGKKRSG